MIFKDPFTGDELAIKNTPTMKNSSSGWWDGATYVDTNGVKWDVVPFTEKGESPFLLPGLLPQLIASKSKPDHWNASVGADNPYGATAGKVLVTGQILVDTLASVDDLAYAKKIKSEGGGFPWWLVLLGLWALSKKKKGRR